MENMFMKGKKTKSYFNKSKHCIHVNINFLIACKKQKKNVNIEYLLKMLIVVLNHPTLVLSSSLFCSIITLFHII